MISIITIPTINSTTTNEVVKKDCRNTNLSVDDNNKNLGFNIMTTLHICSLVYSYNEKIVS